MISVKKGMVLLVLLCCTLLCAAQEEDDMETQVDTVEMVQPPDVALEDSDDEETADYFTAIGDTPVYGKKPLPDTAVRQLRSDPDFWYAQQKPERKKEARPSGGSSRLNSPGLRTFLWILICGSFLAVLVWFLSVSDIRLFSRRPKKLSKEDESLEDNIFLIPFEAEIAKAIAAKNFRLAVRLLYLQLLKSMSDRALIKYTAERTNTDYLMQLLGTAYYRPFSRLTRTFDYVWYGQFPISEEAFSSVARDFDQLKKELPA